MNSEIKEGVKGKILAVDDSSQSRNVLKSYLGDEGYTVITAEDGEEGLAVALDQLPDVILLDVIMPKVDGYEVCRKLKEDERTRFTPVLMITSLEKKEDRIKAVEAGADDFLTKPYDTLELLARVKSMAGKKIIHDELLETTQELKSSNESLKEKMYLMSTLFIVGERIKDELDPADIFRIVHETLVNIIGAETFSIFLYEEGETELSLVTSRGISREAEDRLAAEKGSGVIAEVLETGSPFFYREGAQETIPSVEGKKPPEVGEIPILASVPLKTQNQIFGVINIHKFSEGLAQDTDFELISMISSQVAAAIHNVNVYDRLKTYSDELEVTGKELSETNKKLEQQMFHLNTLSLFSSQLHSTLDLDEIYDIIRDLAVNFIGVQIFYLLFYDENRPIFHTGFADGVTEDEMRALNPGKDKEIVEKVMTTGDPFFASAMEENEREEGSALACLPLTIGDNTKGVFVIERLLPQKEKLEGNDLDLLSLLVKDSALAIMMALLYQKMEETAFIDGLTGLHNHRFFQKRFDQDLSRAKRYGKPLSLILLDIDNFKEINDSYGHLQGDRILKDIATIMRWERRGSDLFARYGDEELATILPETDLKGALLFAERLRAAVEEYLFPTEGLPLKVTISLGVASFPEREGKVNIIKAAEDALNLSKKEGKNRVSYID